MDTHIMVSMPSRASTSLLHREMELFQQINEVCQCPLGLVPHCYEDDCVLDHIEGDGVNALSG